MGLRGRSSGTLAPGQTADRAHMRPEVPQVNAAPMRGCVAPKARLISGLELDLDEHELEFVRIDDIVLDAGLARVRHTGAQRCRHRRLAVEDMQLAGGD